MDNPSRAEVKSWFMSLQDSICTGLEDLDGTARFQEDVWDRPEGGGGRSRVILGSKIEKGGVNFSAVHGEMPSNISAALKLPATDFFATGVSIVLHPKSPMVPIIHMNVRYFEAPQAGRYWFGGGIDVTPHYIFDADARFFHQYLKDICDKHSETYYTKFKKWADDYFYIQHRQETRGIGGIFFDHLAADAEYTKAERWAFVKDVGLAFVPIYRVLMSNNFEKEYGESELAWQRLRRGRYVEFNLVWDKGTKFGLQTNGRIESILMSMPPQADWQYCHDPQLGSTEQRTLEKLKKNINWVEI